VNSINSVYGLSFLLLNSCLCFGQSPTPSDTFPADMPAVVKLLPKPELQPWTPITGQQRWQQYMETTFSPIAGLGAITGAAISQGINSPEEWGQGWGAYGIRVASSYGSTLVGNTIQFGTAALFHEDNRYFPSTSEGVFGKLGHVLISPYLARNMDGHQRFSASSLMGSAGYSGIQLAWSPSSWQGWNNVGINYLIWYGQAAGINLAKEISTSLVRRHRNRQLMSAPNPAMPNR